jgi:hypothetical protein
VVPGYSGASHYAVFRQILSTTKLERLLVLGVYFGRDITFFLDIAMRQARPLSIAGVDKFSNVACEDWPNESRNLNWQEAGFGQPPSLDVALVNVAKFGDVKLIQANDDIFLARCQDKFDAVYIDTSHDYETVVRQTKQSAPLLNPGGFLFGDDYSDDGTWGVKRAVCELVPNHKVFNNWIWFAPQSVV